jgi:hypothetical protein
MQLSELVNGIEGLHKLQGTQSYLNLSSHPVKLSSSQSDKLLADKERSQTRVISPEEVIPLDKDPKQF